MAGLERVKGVGSLRGRAEHKCGTNGNVGSVIKQCAHTTGHKLYTP